MERERLCRAEDAMRGNQPALGPARGPSRTQSARQSVNISTRGRTLAQVPRTRCEVEGMLLCCNLLAEPFIQSQEAGTNLLYCTRISKAISLTMNILNKGKQGDKEYSIARDKE
jgi:hypothetical protein